MLSEQNRVTVNIEDEMRKSYMDYAMSVIVGRALPDVRDGLKLDRLAVNFDEVASLVEQLRSQGAPQFDETLIRMKEESEAKENATGDEDVDVRKLDKSTWSSGQVE